MYQLLMSFEIYCTAFTRGLEQSLYTPLIRFSKPQSLLLLPILLCLVETCFILNRITKPVKTRVGGKTSMLRHLEAYRNIYELLKYDTHFG